MNVTPGFLPLLGVAPARGRAFTAADVAQPVVIVSDAFWHGKLAGDPDALGRRIVLSGQPHTIVGVLPKTLFFGFDPAICGGRSRSHLRKRLVQASVSSPSHDSPALAHPAALAGALDDVSRGSTPSAHVTATPLATALAGDATRTLGLLGAARSLAMLLAFTNLAGLLIVRAIDRRRELAVRNALGATRAEIARQLLLEAQALVTAGVAGGILLAAWTTPVVARLTLAQFGGIAQSRDYDRLASDRGRVARASGARGSAACCRRSWPHGAASSTCCDAAPRRRRASSHCGGFWWRARWRSPSCCWCR